MTSYNCVCLNCSRVLSVELKSDNDLQDTACPSCGEKRLMLLPPVGVYSGGG